MRSSAVLLACVLGCGSPVESSETVRRFDRPTFAADVLPMLEARCGNPSCHARPERPFSLYVPLRWRADPKRTFLDESLTPAEEKHDYDVACALATEADRPENTLILRKPLGVAGGLYHGGGALVSEGDADYRVLFAWLSRGWENP